MDIPVALMTEYVSLSLYRDPAGGTGKAVHLQGNVKDSGRKDTEMEHLSLREPCQGNLEAYKKALQMGTSFHRGLAGKPGRGLICWEIMRGRRFWDECLST